MDKDKKDNPKGGGSPKKVTKSNSLKKPAAKSSSADKKSPPKKSTVKSSSVDKKSPPKKSTVKSSSVDKKSPAKKSTVKSNVAGKKVVKSVPRKSGGRTQKLSVNLPLKRVGYALFALTASLLVLLLLYLLFFFPLRLKGRVRSELISIYSPLVYDESDNLLVLKLAERPDYLLQEEAYNNMRDHYGLELKFEKIFSGKTKGINRLTFYRAGRKISDTGEVYIYWDREIERIVQQQSREEIKPSHRKKSPSEVKQEEKATKSAPLKKEVVKKEVIIKRHTNSEVGYEQIEEKRRKEKKDSVVEHTSYKVTPNRVKERPSYSEAVKIAIVIDDVGYSYNSTYDFLSLGFPITFALIPGVEESDRFYSVIKKAGYDLMLHLPMEPEKGRNFVEEHGLFTDMPEDELRSRVREFIERYPAVLGANNHMGSKAVADARLMNVVIDELSQRNKFWLDSMTTLKTVSREIASLHHVEYYERDTFLDNKKDPASIRQSMDRLIKEARERGYGIGIGHIQSANLAVVLKEYYAKRHELGIEFVSLKELR